LYCDLTLSWISFKAIRQASIFSNLFRPGGGNKTKSKQILCTQRDLLTGLDFHLVEGGGDRPRWVSCQDVDLQTLTNERRSRISRHGRKQDVKDKNSPSLSDPKGYSGKLEGSARAASSSDPEMQVIMQGASRVVADHILEMKRLLLQYGKESIPNTELSNLRKHSDERLQNIFVGKYSYIGDRQRSEMITKAEQSVYGKKPVQNSSTPPNGTASSAGNQNEVATELNENPAARTASSNAGSASVTDPLQKPKYAALSLECNKDVTVKNNILTTGTPCDWSKRIISLHKEFTRSVYSKYDYKFLPSNEMESARQQCVKDLLEIFDSSGIKYSAMQTSALMKEAEDEVLLDHMNTKMDVYRNSVCSVGNRTRPHEEHCSFQSQIQQVYGRQELITSMELNDGFSHSTLPVNASFATGLSSNTESWHDRPRTGFMHSQSQVAQMTSISAPSHRASSGEFPSQLQPPSFQYLSMNHSDQALQNSAVMSTQPWRSSLASGYGNMIGSEALISQQWPQQSVQAPSSMYHNQLQENGAQQHQTSFMAPPGQYSGYPPNSGNGNWFFP
jgi:hypothetical protein